MTRKQCFPNLHLVEHDLAVRVLLSGVRPHAAAELERSAVPQHADPKLVVSAQRA